jgi:hypothetical protein
MTKQQNSIVLELWKLIRGTEQTKKPPFKKKNC